MMAYVKNVEKVLMNVRGNMKKKNPFDPYDNFAEHAFSQAVSRIVITHDVATFDDKGFCTLLANMLSIAADIFDDIGEEKKKTLYSNMMNMLINKALKEEYSDLLLQIIEETRLKEGKDEENA
jgi:hypothetical protein